LHKSTLGFKAESPVQGPMLYNFLRAYLQSFVIS
jgi:hypothetical protein